MTHLIAAEKATKTLPAWPPDVFAICGAILQRSGGYLAVVDDWPPMEPVEGWNVWIADIGKRWRGACAAKKPRGIPEQVKDWWKTITSNTAGRIAIDDVLQHKLVVNAALQLLAAADEACKGIGLLMESEFRDRFDERLLELHWPSGATLCSSAIDASRIIVLPKLHTPQVGITLRSLTHNLALYWPGEVKPRWHWHPFIRGAEDDGKLRLLLLPWPEVMRPEAFSESEGLLRNMPTRRFGFFRCNPRRQSKDPQGSQSLDVSRVGKLFDRAQKKLGRIDGIIFPELALRSGEAESVAALTQRFVIGGCGVEGIDPKPGENFAVMALPIKQGIATEVRQPKHHRWRLEKNQIKQYGLDERLNPERNWWEYIEIKTRELNFVTLSSWLTISFLICEDLARLDPVTELLHAVGPNLVICLLIDGPQVLGRWPSRYATVLADDPGSSVLTITSLGMSVACQTAGFPTSREVAMWRDAPTGAAQEITLDAGCSGIVLTLSRNFGEEFSADGRSDNSRTAFLKLENATSI